VAPGTLARKIWVALAITIAFLTATIFLVSLPASRFTDPTGTEYAAAVARFIVGLIAIFAIRKLNWDSNALSSPSSWAWLIVVPVAVYSMIVYPLLFTGTLALKQTIIALLFCFRRELEGNWGQI
jgi:CDP-diglyceride synthetase